MKKRFTVVALAFSLITIAGSQSAFGQKSQPMSDIRSEEDKAKDAEKMNKKKQKKHPKMIDKKTGAEMSHDKMPDHKQ